MVTGQLIHTAERFKSFPPYPLADVPQIKRELIAKGVDVIDLGAGDADLLPPPAAVQTLKESVDNPLMSRYGFQLGLPAYREAVSAWMKKRFNAEFDPFQEIIPLVGSKEGLAHLAFCYVEPGDITIIPDPGYQPYLGGTLLSGGSAYAVPLRPEHDFLIPLEDLPDDVVQRAKILYLNYPNNPTAAIAPREYLEQAVRFCQENGILLVYDNAYSEVAFDGYVPPGIFEIEGARDVAVEFHSFSKTYNMTGWRLGWAAGNASVISALSRIKAFVDTGQFLAVQAAGKAALESYDTWVPKNIQAFQSRRDAMVNAMRKAGFEVETPRATMYLWVPVPGSATAQDFTRRALLEQGVVLMSGTALGEGGYGFFRIALTQSEARLEEAAGRLARLL